MAKTQKFKEDLLLTAVVKFSENTKTKIKATELAAWARENIKGLEEVRDYHFTRPIREKDEKTGKVNLKVKPCTEKIEEINKTRDVSNAVKKNVLLSSSNIDIFFQLPITHQRKTIIETRETVDKLIKKNIYLSNKNETLAKANEEYLVHIEMIKDSMIQIQRTQRRIESYYTYFINLIDENTRRETIEQMGIKDESIDIMAYKKSLDDDINKMFNIAEAIKLYEKDVSDEDDKLLDDVMEGIDFGN